MGPAPTARRGGLAKRAKLHYMTAREEVRCCLLVPNRSLPLDGWLGGFMAGLERTSILMSGQQKSVLVVDDEPAVRELVQVLLRNLGYLVETAASGVEALGKIEDPGVRRRPG